MPLASPPPGGMVRVDGVATECGMARGDPALFPELLAAHAKTAELASG